MASVRGEQSRYEVDLDFRRANDTDRSVDKGELSQCRAAENQEEWRSAPDGRSGLGTVPSRRLKKQRG
ncbi:hypothetical protein CTA1_2316 [Colletotrichum tanaceti]|uniref:Uncharacterized protein n=1 Tax=Colletotrichum tanaceti TaxID=1306861 RepID=A0A4U6X3H9_9PEZI|nr:hypothetical protein CTA1_2316 [Colletotrichum tanaceti]